MPQAKRVTPHMENTIVLEELTPGATIRFTAIDGVQYLSIVDFIMHICNTSNDYAGQIWRNIPDVKKKEIYEFTHTKNRSVRESKIKPLAWFQFPGPGQKIQTVITFPAALKLVMMLPGKHAARYKSKCAELISRYLDGDASMTDEIEENRSIGQKRSYSRFAQDITTRVDAEIASEIPESQYIYATKSAAFPGLIKIGRTTDMRARLSQLNTACAPAPHVLISIVPTKNMYRDEHLAHEHFASSRKAGEFFEVQESEVKKYFRKIILRRYQKDLIASLQT